MKKVFCWPNVAITYNRPSVFPPNSTNRVEHATRQGGSSSKKSLFAVPGYFQIFDMNLFKLISWNMKKQIKLVLTSGQLDTQYNTSHQRKTSKKLGLVVQIDLLKSFGVNVILNLFLQ